MSRYLKERKGWFYYQRKVPRDLVKILGKSHIQKSLNTQNKSEAITLALNHNEKVEHYFANCIRLGREEADIKYNAAVDLVGSYGLKYLSASELSERASVNDLIKRAELVQSTKSEDIKDAILGRLNPPDVKIGDVLDDMEQFYFKHIAEKWIQKDEHARKKFKNPRIKALKNFIMHGLNNDHTRLVAHIERADVLKFREWHVEKVAAGTSSTETQRKEFSHTKDILRIVGLTKNLDIDSDSLFKDTNLKQVYKSRPPFEADYVQNVLINGGALDSMTPEYKMMVFAFADTGCSLSELHGLTGDDIVLDAEIPHILVRITEDRKELKTKHRIRQIPLVGSARHAFKQFPDGFSKDKLTDSISNAINKFFHENDLYPTKNHSLYSLRHTFKDRLRDVEAPQEMIDQLMGHKPDGQWYGRGHLLEKKYKYMKEIAYKVNDAA